MAEYNSQRYYWIKLTDRFMTSDTVDFLMEQPNGAKYVVLYQMLCLKSVNNGGELSRKIGEIIIPFNEEKIQRDTKWFDIDTIRVAMQLYKRLGLIYEQEDGVLKIADFDRLVGSQTDGAERKQLQRQKRDNGLLTAGGQTSGQNSGQVGGQSGGQKVDKCPPDTDIRDKDKDKDKEIDIDKDNYIHTQGNGNQTTTKWQPNGNQTETDFEKRLNEFCNKWQVRIDSYSPLLADLDFEKLDKAYLESAKFLQVAPVARCISWVIKNAVSIYNGKYKDKPTGGGDSNGGETKQKGYYDDFLDSIGRLE